MIRCVSSDQDAAIRTIIAATKTSERHWLSELPGWAPEMIEEYAANIITKDMPKGTDVKEYQLEDDQGS